MLNYIWSGMILLGIGWSAFHGKLDEVTLGILNGGADAVSLGITMLGVLSFWSGVMEVGQKSGLADWLAGKMKPVVVFLFPGLDPGCEAARYITINMIANMLGLGSAATPAGLAAFRELEKAEDKRRAEGKKWAVPQGTASNEMCTFLILNISSLQLIPVNIIAYRSQYGSADPAMIAGPAIAATMISTIAAAVFCKAMDRKPYYPQDKED